MVEVIRARASYIFLDVVNYSRDRSVEAQTDIIAVLNRTCRVAIDERQFHPDQLILLPTGDGICIAILNVEALYDEDVLLALRIVAGVEQHNKATEDVMRRFQVRIGINTNLDNVVTDINDRRNIAGAGINVAQRVMSMADGNQILITEPVYDRLRPREQYMNAFRSYAANVKHDVRLPVYQLIQEGHQGLNRDTPSAFRTMERQEPRLTEVVAYYFAHAISNRDFFITKLGYEDSMVGTILLWFLAQDSTVAARAGPFGTPYTRTYMAGKAKVQEQFEHYSSLGYDIVTEFADLVGSGPLHPYYKYFEVGDVIDYRLIKPEGEEKLRAEWASIWDQFGLGPHRSAAPIAGQRSKD